MRKLELTSPQQSDWRKTRPASSAFQQPEAPPLNLDPKGLDGLTRAGAVPCWGGAGSNVVPLASRKRRHVELRACGPRAWLADGLEATLRGGSPGGLVLIMEDYRKYSTRPRPKPCGNLPCRVPRADVQSLEIEQFCGQRDVPERSAFLQQPIGRNGADCCQHLGERRRNLGRSLISHRPRSATFLDTPSQPATCESRRVFDTPAEGGAGGRRYWLSTITPHPLGRGTPANHKR